jgi:hypothetical protein
LTLSYLSPVEIFLHKVFQLALDQLALLRRHTETSPLEKCLPNIFLCLLVEMVVFQAKMNSAIYCLIKGSDSIRDEDHDALEIL